MKHEYPLGILCFTLCEYANCNKVRNAPPTIISCNRGLFYLQKQEI